MSQVRVLVAEHMSNSVNVQAWRKRAKQKVVEIAGGKCNLCSYDKCISALEFHHIDPNEKDFAVTGTNVTRRFDLMVEEVRKCILVCANCHREIHAGLYEESELDLKKKFCEDVAMKYLAETRAARDKGKFKSKGSATVLASSTDLKSV